MSNDRRFGGSSLEAVDAALDDLAARPTFALLPEELAEQTVRLQAIRARVEGLCCASAAAAERVAAHAGSGLRTLPDYVAREAKCDPKPVARDRTLGRWVDRYPLFAEAFVDGHLTRSHVQALKAADNRRTATALVGAQEFFIETARTMSWRDFNEVLRYWVLAADPDGEEPSEQLESRTASTHKRADGMVKGSFLLDPIGGHAALTALQQEEQRLFRADQETSSARTVAQRRADALVALLTKGATRTDGTTPAPLVHLVVGEHVLCDALHRLDPDSDASVNPFRLPLDHSDPTTWCQLVDGTPIHPVHVTAAVMIADIARLVLGAPGRVLDLGENGSAVPAPPQRSRPRRPPRPLRHHRLQRPLQLAPSRPHHTIKPPRTHLHGQLPTTLRPRQQDQTRPGP